MYIYIYNYVYIGDLWTFCEIPVSPDTVWKLCKIHCSASATSTIYPNIMYIYIYIYIL